MKIILLLNFYYITNHSEIKYNFTIMCRLHKIKYLPVTTPLNRILMYINQIKAKI